MQSGRDAGGSRSGAATPAEEDDSEYEKIEARPKRGLVEVVGGDRRGKDYDEESGMGVGARADALGDRSLEGSEAGEVEEEVQERDGDGGEAEEVEEGGRRNEDVADSERNDGPKRMVDSEFLEAKRDRSLRESVY